MQTSEKQIARIKTAFIYNFTKYVGWPNEEDLNEFTIGVMSSPTLAQELKELVPLVKFRNKLPIKVVYFKTVKDIGNCQILVVDGNGSLNLWSVYSKIKDRHVLMVAENLRDFKKSMISFTVVDNKMKYTINKTKLAESGLTVKKLLYDLAITTEGEWKSLFEKFDHLLKTQEGEVKVEKAELAQMLDMYKALEKSKRDNETTIAHLSDSMQAKLDLLKTKTREYERISAEILKQKQVLEKQQERLKQQHGELFIQDSKITQQRNVIMVIGALASFVVILLVFAIRSNNHRRRANQLLSARKTEIERQKQLVETKQKEILDSINYAKRIQRALMANETLMKAALPEYFILFKPKDIVAGDFYWASQLSDSFLYVTGDSTGHGVPGAFMSLLNITKLNEAVNQKLITRPDLVLNYVRDKIIAALNPEGSREESKDGMDAIVCRIDHKKMKLQYAAANSNFCIIRKREIINLRADKIPVGKSNDDTRLFTFNEISLEKGDMIYTFSDGYGDQFGGPKGKKFKHRILKEVLLKISELSPETQKSMLAKHLDDWRGELEQVDDVLVIGVRV